MRALFQRLLVPRADRERLPAHGIALPRNVVASIAASSIEAALIPILVEVFGVYYMAAVVSCALLATCVSFALNKYWVFEARWGRVPYQLGKQIAVAGGSILANSGIIYTLTERGGLHYFLSYVVSNVCVFFAWNYPMSRWFVFGERPGAGAATRGERPSGG